MPLELESLGLTNFRSYTSAELALGRRTLIYGRNEHGKSTTVDAILWALTGWCRGLDGAGRGVGKLMCDLAETKTMAVRLKVKGLGTIVRTATPKQVTLTVEDAVVSKGGRTGTMKGPVEKVQQAIYDHLGVTKAILIAALDSAALIDAGHADAKNLLLKLLDVSVTVPGECWADGKERTLTLDELAVEEQAAATERADLKRRLISLGAEPFPPSEWDGPTRDSLTAQITALETATSDARAARAAADASRSAIERRRRDIISRTDKHVGVEGLLAQWQAKRGPVVGELNLLRKPGRTADSLAEDVAREEGAIASETVMVERLLKERPSGACVLSQAIICKTDQSEFTTFIDRTAAAIDAKRDELATLQAELNRARHFEGLTTELGVIDDRIASFAALKATYDEDKARLAEVDAELAALNVPAADPREEDLASLRGTLARLESHERKVQAVIDDRATRAGLVEQIEKAEALCAQLGPKGVLVDALTLALASFEADANRFLASWGYTITITPDPWQISVNGRPAVLLSRSQRLRLGMGIQYAIAWRAGLECVIYDDVDMLDDQNSAALASFVLGKLKGGQVLIVATRNPGYEPPAVPGLLAHHIVMNAKRVSNVESPALASA